MAIDRKMQSGGTTTPTTEEKVETLVTQQAGIGDEKAKLPEGTSVNPVLLQEETNEILAQQGLGTDPTTATAQAPTTGLEVAVPQSTSASTYQAYTLPNTPQAEAAQGTLNSQAVVGNIQGAVSDAAKAQAATGTVSEKATVKYQLAELFKSMEDGTDLPAWAAPAVRKVSAIMAQRGLGSSSIASAAITQAVLESAIPIAAADAKTYAAIDLKNLSNEQQATLQNAATVAAMDRANLSV